MHGCNKLDGVKWLCYASRERWYRDAGTGHILKNTEEELQRVNPSQEPIRITQFVNLIMNAINDPGPEEAENNNDYRLVD